MVGEQPLNPGESLTIGTSSTFAVPMFFEGPYVVHVAGTISSTTFPRRAFEVTVRHSDIWEGSRAVASIVHVDGKFLDP